MFCVVYQIKIKPDSKHRIRDFIEAWSEMTNLIKKYEGGLGSRLHRVNELEYIAYAQWPDRETWEAYGDHMPPSAEQARSVMKSCYASFTAIHTMDMIKDQLDSIKK